MSSPRMRRISSFDAARRSRPSKVTLPLTRAPVNRVRPMTVRLETVLPEPDSPTIPSDPPDSTE